MHFDLKSTKVGQKLGKFSMVITSIGKEKANLSAFNTLVRFALVLFSVFASSWCLGRAAACNCSTPWIFLLTFYDD